MFHLINLLTKFGYSRKLQFECRYEIVFNQKVAQNSVFLLDKKIYFRYIYLLTYNLYIAYIIGQILSKIEHFSLR